MTLRCGQGGYGGIINREKGNLEGRSRDPVVYQDRRCKLCGIIESRIVREGYLADKFGNEN